MKKLFLGLMLIMMTFSLFSQSNEAQKERRYSIQINPLLLVVDLVQLVSMTENVNIAEESFLIGLEFQYAMKNYVTISIEPRFGIGNSMFFYGQGFGYGSNGVTLNSSWGGVRPRYILLTLNPGLLFRMSGTGLKGGYIGIYTTMGWKNASRDAYLSNPSVDDNFFILGVTGGVGYQWVFRRGFTMSLGGGLGKTWEIESKDNTGIYDGSNKFLVDFILNFKLGYSF